MAQVDYYLALQSPFVYLAGKDNKAARRKVTAARTIGPNWVVTGGLKAGDRVITQGLGNLRKAAPGLTSARLDVADGPLAQPGCCCKMALGPAPLLPGIFDTLG
mgnify:CR=1 FL=1